jgi:hypothetical protein
MELQKLNSFASSELVHPCLKFGLHRFSSDDRWLIATLDACNA